MRIALAILLLITFNGCAAYSLTVTLADGTTVRGRALVANESSDVALEVKSGALDASFRKINTDSGAPLEAITDIAGAALNPTPLEF